MGKIFIKSSVFFVLLLLTLFGLNSLFLKKDLLRANNIYLLPEEECVDILFLGSSHVFSSIDVKYLNRKTNSNSFILATPAQCVGHSLFLFQEFLKYKKPKVVFFEAYSLRNRFGDNLFHRHAAIDGVNLSIDKILKVYDWYLQDSTLDISQSVDLVFPILAYHERWNGELAKEDFKYFSKREVSYGSQIPPAGAKNFISDSTYYFNYRIDTVKSVEPLPSDVLSDFMSIKKLCDENKIRLVVFSTPYLVHSGYSVERQKRTLNYMENVLYKDSIDILNFNLLYDELALNDKCFYDHHHLNSLGAAEQNVFLANWIEDRFSSLLPKRDVTPDWMFYLKGDKEEVVNEIRDLGDDEEKYPLEKAALLKISNKYYLVCDLNDSIDENAFRRSVNSNERLRLMIHLHVEGNPKFGNSDCKPEVKSFEGNKFIFTEVVTSSGFEMFDFVQFAFFDSKGRKKMYRIINKEVTITGEAFKL